MRQRRCIHPSHVWSNLISIVFIAKWSSAPVGASPVLCKCSLHLYTWICSRRLTSSGDAAPWCGHVCTVSPCNVKYYYVPERSFMHLPVSAWFLISSADFIYRCIICLNCTSAVKKYYAPAHAQMRKKKRKVGRFSEKKTVNRSKTFSLMFN